MEVISGKLEEAGDGVEVVSVSSLLKPLVNLAVQEKDDQNQQVPCHAHIYRSNFNSA